MPVTRDIESGLNEKSKPSARSSVTQVAGEQDGGTTMGEKPAEEDVVWVDWEGPDDPENPKKCVKV